MPPSPRPSRGRHLAALGGLLALAALAPGGAQAANLTYDTPGEQTVVVPTGTTAMEVVLHGAGGGVGTRTGGEMLPSTSFGGAGGAVTARIPVTPGQTVVIRVGGAGGTAGGFNGGGAGVAAFTDETDGAEYRGGGGGGATDIRFGGTRIAVAPGGGGGGGTASGRLPGSASGGAGGGDTGANGATAATGANGRGGTQTAGGAAGTGDGAGSTAGSSGQGGAAGADTFSGGTGGGGGGGLYGGGGGAVSGGGGGGSALVPSGGTTTVGGGAARGVDGRAEITWTTTDAPSGLASSPASPSFDGSPAIRGTAPSGSTVELFANASCSGSPVATGTAEAFAAPGFTVTVPEDATTTFAAQAVTGDARSACSEPLTYVEDSTVAQATSLSVDGGGTTSPDTQFQVRVGGVEPGSTVRLFSAPTTADCTPGRLVGEQANAAASQLVNVEIPANQATTFRATVEDRAGNVSTCSSASFTYTSDSIGPAAVTDVAFNPASPSSDATPTLTATAPADAVRITVHRAGNCTDAIGQAGYSRAQMANGVEVPVTVDDTSTVALKVFDAAGNGSDCVARTYRHEASGPGAPTIESSDPPSGSQAPTIRVRGAVDDGVTTVRLHLVAGCAGAPAATGTRADFEGGGIAVTVPPGTSSISASATDDQGVNSPCSTARTHVRDPDLVAPSPTITAPADGTRTTDATPDFAGLAGTAPFDEATVRVEISGGPTLETTRDAASGAWSATPAQPLAPGTYTATAVQRDAGGNVGRSAPVSFSVVAPPDPPRTTAPVATTSSARSQPTVAIPAPDASSLRITSVRAARNGVLTVRFSASGAGRLVLRATAPGLRGVYATRVATIRAAGRGTVVLRPTAAARRRFARGRSSAQRTVTLRATLTPRMGRAAGATAKVRLPARGLRARR